MTDTLNIEFHTRRLLMKSLNTCKNKKIAAKAAGISERQIHRFIKRFSIKQDQKTKEYFYTEKIMTP